MNRSSEQIIDIAISHNERIFKCGSHDSEVSEALQRDLCYICPRQHCMKTRENEGTEREAPGTALGICHVHESYF